METPLPQSDATNVHLDYIRRDIGEIKTTLAEMKNAYVTRVDFDEHLKQDEDHEDRLRLLEEGRWKLVGATGIIIGILTIIGEYFVSHL